MCIFPLSCTKQYQTKVLLGDTAGENIACHALANFEIGGYFVSVTSLFSD